MCKRRVQPKPDRFCSIRDFVERICFVGAQLKLRAASFVPYACTLGLREFQSNRSTRPKLTSQVATSSGTRFPTQTKHRPQLSLSSSS